MKIAVVHNIEHSGVINRFGRPNKEMYYRDEIDAFIENLKENGHEVKEFDGDMHLLTHLKSYLPPMTDGEKPEGLVFNLAYGIQGNNRYAHIPAMLEMAGVPYTGSGPMTHAIALDKEMTKRVLLQCGIPTPRFIVVDGTTNAETLTNHNLMFPLIIKPKDEAASFGISVVDNEDELVTNTRATMDEYDQPLVVEEYHNGRELNVAILGNGETLEAFEPVEIDFNASGDRFQSFAGKKGGRYQHICPAEISDTLKHELQDISKKTFNILKCCDYARIDFRLDKEERPYVLEINSMAAIHRKGSFFHAAKVAGYTYSGMLHKMVNGARDRYQQSEYNK